MWDYVIYGGGPSGIVLALLLREKFSDKTILLVERDSKLGGCWKMEWTQDGLFTEHAPRVISGSNFQNVLKYLDLDPNESLVDVYSDKWSTILGQWILFSKDIIASSTLFDVYKFVLYYILWVFSINSDTKITDSEYTVYDWLNKYKFSENFKTIINKFCILIADISSRVTLYDLFQSIAFSNFKRLKNSQEWLERFTERLSDKGIQILYNTELTRFIDSNKSIVNNNTIINSKNTILCISPHVISTILNNSPNNIKYNWGINVPKILSNSYYMCIGFQLHYNTVIDPEFCKNSLTCNTPWNIVILNITKDSLFTKNNEIKTVLSCAVIDKREANKYTTKTSLSTELKRQTSFLIPTPPTHLTFYDGVEYIDGMWVSKDSGYIRQKSNKLIPYNGNYDNLSLVGSFNARGVSTIDKAIDNVIDFVDTLQL